MFPKMLKKQGAQGNAVFHLVVCCHNFWERVTEQGTKSANETKREVDKPQTLPCPLNFQMYKDYYL